MKLLVDLHVFDRKFQGVRTYLEGLYTHMTKYRDIEFYFAAHDVEKLRETFGEAENIHYVQLSERGQIIRLATEFPKIIRENDIDYAHFQYITPLFKCCKEIVNIHDLLFVDYPQYFPWRYRMKFKYLFRRAAKKSDLILTISKFSRDSLVRNFGVSKEKIYITPIGVLPETTEVDIDGIKNKYNLKKYILFVSRVEPRKNHLALLKAFEELELSKMGYKLVFIGGRDIGYESFSNYLNSLPKEEQKNILMLQVPFSELVAFYHGASLFVFPSLGEGFGIPPIEAVAYGCPLLCSTAPAMSEFELPDEISFDPNNIEELKSKMKTQLLNPLSPSTYRNRIMSEYDWDKIASDYYQELLRRGIVK